MKLPRLPRSTTVLHAKYTAEQMKAYAQKCLELEREACVELIPPQYYELREKIRARGQT